MEDVPTTAMQYLCVYPQATELTREIHVDYQFTAQINEETLRRGRRTCSNEVRWEAVKPASWPDGNLPRQLSAGVW